METPISRLRAALTEVADALATADLPRLLAAEPQLGEALDGVTAINDADRVELDAARAELLRCRRLGAGLVTFARLCLDPEDVQMYTNHRGARGAIAEARG